MRKNAIVRLVELINGAAAREKADHLTFLDTYEALVRASGPEVSKAFGKLNVKVLTPEDGREHTYGLVLSPADYLWWRAAIMDRGVQFTEGAAEARMSVLNHLGGLSETQRMTPAERAEFLDLMKNDGAANA